MMRKVRLAFATLALTSAPFVLAAPGEYWETTTKSEMAGMPMAIPPMTVKVCVAKGAERTPQKSEGCEYASFVNEGNRASWKVTCNQHGSVMTGTGEATYSADASDGKMHMVGTSSGHKFDMTMTFHSKRLGGACDSDEEARKLKAQGDKIKAQADAQVAKMCETKGFTTQQWVSRASMYADGKTCGADKKQALCEVLRRDMPRDAQAFVQFSSGERTTKGSLAQACGLDTAALTKTACSGINAKNIDMLAAYCPAEARTLRAAMRRKACEGRSYTAKADLSKCLARAAAEDGESGSSRTSDNATNATSAGTAATAGATSNNNKSGNTGNKSSKGNAGKSQTPHNDDVDEPGDDGAKWGQKSKQSGPTDAAVENAKKLKGLFGL